MNSIDPKASSDKENKSSSDLPSLSPEIPPSPPTAENPYKCRHHKTPWWKIVLDFGTFFAVLGAFVAAAIYACIAARQLTAMNKTYDEIQKQTAFQRQQMVGIQGAVVEVGPVWNATTQVLTISLANANQTGVSGIVSNFKAKVQRKMWPKEQPIGDPFLIELPNPEITILKGGQFTIDKGLPWPLPPQLKNQNFWPGKEVVTLEGSYTYDDGFGDLHPYKFCYLWTAPWNLTMPPPNGGGWSGGQWSGGKRGCPSVQEKLTSFWGSKNTSRKLRPNRIDSPVTVVGPQF
jgi:hypothetical protein